MSATEPPEPPEPPPGADPRDRFILEPGDIRWTRFGGQPVEPEPST
jgi:hypothetical protein